ncbi:MAG: hypothetical protein APF81_12795 [Desulfosporosinus sp. BRH_c37]|nr:MAG: hypothetical protein APF81_12795 [Desulfosporosinus sp. BRH_c37]
MSLINVCEVTKTYRCGDGVVEAITNVNLQIAEGEFLALSPFASFIRYKCLCSNWDYLNTSRT